MAPKSCRDLRRLDNRAGASFVQNLVRFLRYVLPQSKVVLAETKVQDGNRNTISVNLVTIERHSIFRPCQDFSPAAHLNKTWLQLPYLPLERLAKSLHGSCLVREHKAGVVQLIVESAHVGPLLFL